VILLGVDPGVSGAIAALDHNGVLLGVRDLPTIALPGEGAMRRRLNGAGLVKLIRELVPANDKAIAYVENVQAWDAGKGAASSMAAMVGSKLVLFAILDLFASHVAIQSVPPVTWKRFFGLKREKDETTTSFKARSREQALALYPEADILLAKHEGRAEALLIAAYGRDREGFRDDLLAEPRPLSAKQMRDAEIDARIPF
jgi:hypothetical protein